MRSVRISATREKCACCARMVGCAVHTSRRVLVIHHLITKLLEKTLPLRKTVARMSDQSFMAPSCSGHPKLFGHHAYFRVHHSCSFQGCSCHSLHGCCSVHESHQEWRSWAMMLQTMTRMILQFLWNNWNNSCSAISSVPWLSGWAYRSASDADSKRNILAVPMFFCTFILPRKTAYFLFGRSRRGPVFVCSEPQSIFMLCSYRPRSPDDVVQEMSILDT